MFELVSPTPEFTRELGAGLSRILRAGDVVSLGGELGAGKTCLTQGIADGLGISATVTSPTFVIMREYGGRTPLVHLDVYRFERLTELSDLGAEEVFRPDAVAVVEWGDQVGPLLPASHLHVDLEYHPDGRRLVFTGHGDWADRVPQLRGALQQEGAWGRSMEAAPRDHGRPYGAPPFHAGPQSE